MTEEGSQVAGWNKGQGWGWIWGEGDEVGALNAMTSQTVLSALVTVTEGRIYDMGVTMDRKSFLWPGHVGTEVVAFRTPDGILRTRDLGFDDPEGISFHTSLIIISDHAGTQLDGLCHATFGPDRHWYNGNRVEQWSSDFGPRKAGAENIPPIIVPGVLIDVPGHMGVPELEAGFAVDPALLQATLDWQGLDIEPGDAVFVRSGSLRHWGEAGEDHDKLAGPDTSGINLAGARWLVEEKGAILVASDTSTVEVIPPVDGDNASPVHKYLLVDQGVHMGELHYLEDLAADKVYRFCYIALAPKVRGSTAGFAMRPVAVV